VIRPVEAISFDLWDTLFIDDSDEPVRARQGMRPKKAERRFLAYQALSRHHPVAKEQVDLAYDVVDAAFRKVWYEHQVTWTVRQRLGILLDGLQLTLPEDELAELIRAHEEMELGVRPRLVPGATASLERLRGRYKLAVVSDAIFSPGRALRELLRGENILGFFEALIFSDEAGCSKPNPAVFLQAAAQLGVPAGHLVHIGDREHTDVRGAHAAGARAILFTAIRMGEPDNSADAVCHGYEELPQILARLDGAQTNR
jgi:putative hydrolase of the HAD superfamily